VIGPSIVSSPVRPNQCNPQKSPRHWRSSRIVISFDHKCLPVPLLKGGRQVLEEVCPSGGSCQFPDRRQATARAAGQRAGTDGSPKARKAAATPRRGIPLPEPACLPFTPEPDGICGSSRNRASKTCTRINKKQFATEVGGGILFPLRCRPFPVACEFQGPTNLNRFQSCHCHRFKGPDFTLKTKTADGPEDVKMSENAGKKPLCSCFPAGVYRHLYPEMCDVTLAWQYSGLNAVVYGISVDTPLRRKAWAKQNKITARSSATSTRSHKGLRRALSGLAGIGRHERPGRLRDRRGRTVSMPNRLQRQRPAQFRKSEGSARGLILRHHR